jgi:hypothetical protein
LRPINLMKLSFLKIGENVRGNLWMRDNSYQENKLVENKSSCETSNQKTQLAKKLNNKTWKFCSFFHFLLSFDVMTQSFLNKCRRDNNGKGEMTKHTKGRKKQYNEILNKHRRNQPQNDSTTSISRCEYAH